MAQTPKPAPFPRGRVFHRGDVWLVRSDTHAPAVGNENWSNRPALIVSSDAYNNASGFAQIIYLTTSPNKRASSLHVPLDLALREDGLTLAMCEQIHTVDASRLVRYMNRITLAEQGQINAGLTRSLGITTEPERPAAGPRLAAA